MLLGVARGIVQFVTVAVLGGVCLVFGFVPNEFVAAIITNPPDWLGHPGIRVAAVFGGGGFGYLAWKIWPWRSVSTPPLTQRISARQAIDYLADDSKWGWRTWLELRGHSSDVAKLLAADRFRKAAQQAVISVRGRRWHNQDYEDIDSDLWNRIKIEETSILDNSNNPGSTESAVVQFPIPPRFQELSVNANEVCQTWPPASGTYRVSMRGGLFLIKLWWLALWPIERAVIWWKRWRAENT
jgi:hypothetical protein